MFMDQNKHINNMSRKDLGLEEDSQMHRKRLNQLYQERKDIITNIKALNRKKRFIIQGERQQKTEDQRLNKDVKPSISTQQPRSCQSLGEHHTHVKINEEQIRILIGFQSGIKDRNKRLFGGINSLLKQAQNRIKDQLPKTKTRKEIEQQAFQKKNEQQLKIQQQQRREIEAQLEELIEEKDKNSNELLQTENIILKNKFITYVSDLQNSLFTKSQPSIAWKPVSYNTQLEALKQKQAASLQALAEKKSREIMGYNQKFDFTQYTHANQRQYYNNILDNYFRSKIHFFITKKSPPIAWMPSREAFSKMQGAFVQNREPVVKELSRRKEENDQFYKRFSKEHQRQQQIDQAQSESGN